MKRQSTLLSFFNSNSEPAQLGPPEKTQKRQSLECKDCEPDTSCSASTTPYTENEPQLPQDDLEVDFDDSEYEFQLDEADEPNLPELDDNGHNLEGDQEGEIIDTPIIRQ